MRALNVVQSFRFRRSVPKGGHQRHPWRLRQFHLVVRLYFEDSLDLSRGSSFITETTPHGGKERRKTDYIRVIFVTH
jgi:hypothetical protein